jgi:tRNA dimethylallyltransferase
VEGGALRRRAVIRRSGSQSSPLHFPVLETGAVDLKFRMQDEFFLVGPTAVGKSSIAIEVAEELGAEIVNADAFQIYRGFDILTAKPDAAGQRRVRHHLLSAVELHEEMSAVKFRAMALAAFGEIRSRGRKAIVVSGSGLYVKALTHGFDQMAPPDPELRGELRLLSDNELAQRIVQLDPGVAAEIDLKNRRRVMRAIEIAESTTASTETKQAVIPSESRGIPLRDLKASATGSLDFARDGTEKKAGGVCLVRERDDLYVRINGRVQQMFREGVEAEVARLKNIGATARQALGLREIQQLLAGEVSRADCIAKIQQATRRYAKRQLTWFRHQTNFPLLNLTALSHREVISAITRAIAQE